MSVVVGETGASFVSCTTSWTMVTHKRQKAVGKVNIERPSKLGN